MTHPFADSNDHDGYTPTARESADLNAFLSLDYERVTPRAPRERRWVDTSARDFHRLDVSDLLGA